jgi:plasmid stabilization system protein ParE
MAIEIFWTKFAQDKLDRIYVYYKNVAGDKVAKNLIQSIIKQTINLANHPEMGQKEVLLSNRPETFR